MARPYAADAAPERGEQVCYGVARDVGRFDPLEPVP
jgi:hypothetical protein